MEDIDQPIPDPVSPDPVPPAPIAAPPGLSVTPPMLQYWREISTWAYVFAGMLGVYTLFSLIQAAVMPNPAEEMPMGLGQYRWGMTLVGVVLTLLPAWFYFKFAGLLKQGMRNSDRDAMDQSFDHLRYYYMFMGILTIGYIVLMIAFMVIAIAFASKMRF